MTRIKPLPLTKGESDGVLELILGRGGCGRDENVGGVWVFDFKRGVLLTQLICIKESLVGFGDVQGS